MKMEYAEPHINGIYITLKLKMYPLPEDLPPHIVKGGVLPLVPENKENFFQQRRGGGVHKQPLLLAVQEKVIGVSLPEVLAPVDLACGQPVANISATYFFGISTPTIPSPFMP